MPTNTVACASQWRTGYACAFCREYAAEHGYSIEKGTSMTHRTEYGEYEDELMTPEEFAQSCKEWKARGPFTAQPFVKTWIVGHERASSCFVVLDSVGVRVGIAADQSQAERWARELTANGYIED